MTRPQNFSPGSAPVQNCITANARNRFSRVISDFAHAGFKYPQIRFPLLAQHPVDRRRIYMYTNINYFKRIHGTSFGDDGWNVAALLYEFIPGRVAGRYNNIVNFYYHDTRRVVSDFAHLATSDSATRGGFIERARKKTRNTPKLIVSSPPCAIAS